MATLRLVTAAAVRPRRGRPTGASSEETRRRVLDAARRAFSGQGYSGATMRGIAAEAGLTAMALYTYAPSKAALFEAVWEDGIEDIYVDYEQVVAGRGSLVEEVDALLDRSRELLLERPDHTRLVLRMLVEHEHPELAAADLRVPVVADFFAELADRSVRRGEIGRRERQHLTMFLATLLWGITTLNAFDATSLDHAVAAAKWAARRSLAT